MSISERELLSVVNNIYAAPMQQGGWVKALHSVTALFRASGSTYSGTLSNAAIYQPTFMYSDFDKSKALNDYIEYYHSICERARFSLREKVGSAYYDYKYFSESEMQKSEYYSFLTRNGGKYAMGATLGRRGRANGGTGTQQCAIHFSDKLGHPDKATVDVFKRLVPHMMQANQIDLQISKSRAIERGVLAMLHRMPNAVIGLDADAKVCFINQKADDILTADDGIKVADGRLVMKANSSQRSFATCLRHIFTDDALLAAHDPALVMIERPSGKRPIVLSLSPLGAQDAEYERMGSGQVRYLAILSEPDCSVPVSEAELAKIFAFTKSEAKLAFALCNGMSLQHYCKVAGIAYQTARFHLKGVFAKAGVQRQADLIRLITSLHLTGN